MTEAKIQKPDGTFVQKKANLVYLGSLLSDDSQTGVELSRRLGMARADFQKLCMVWSHSDISVKRQVEIFDACIGAKLMVYSRSGSIRPNVGDWMVSRHAACVRYWALDLPT